LLATAIATDAGAVFPEMMLTLLNASTEAMCTFCQISSRKLVLPVLTTQLDKDRSYFVIDTDFAMAMENLAID